MQGFPTAVAWCRSWVRFAFRVCVLAMLPWLSALGQEVQGLVTAQHLAAINNSFVRNGISAGRVESDPYGRVVLKGEYADEQEVDRAFSLAQVVVGARWVSPVTPEGIRVKAWERRLGGLFARSSVLAPPVRGDLPPGPIRNRYALVVGVGQFMHGIQPLEFAARDAMNFYQFLTDPRRGQFQPANVVYLTDGNATRANVGAALANLQRVAEDDD